MDIDLTAMYNYIDGMGFQNMVALLRKHEEEWHVLDNVLIGRHNPKMFNLQGLALEEWDASDDANAENT